MTGRMTNSFVDAGSGLWRVRWIPSPRYARVGRSATMKIGPSRGNNRRHSLGCGAGADDAGSGPFFFHVIEGVARIADLGEHAKQYAREHRPDSVGYSWAEGSDFKVFLDAPVVIVISGHADNSQSIQDCNRAGQNLMLSAHARGLGSCWVGAPMLWLRNPETRKELGIAEAFEPFAAFALGYAASVPPLRSRERPEIVWV